MGLNTSQYDAIMREYDRVRLNHKRDLDERVREIYNKIPRIKEINDSISSISVAGAKRMLLDNTGNTLGIKDIKKERKYYLWAIVWFWLWPVSALC